MLTVLLWFIPPLGDVNLEEPWEIALFSTTVRTSKIDIDAIMILLYARTSSEARNNVFHTQNRTIKREHDTRQTYVLVARPPVQRAWPGGIVSSD